MLRDRLTDALSDLASSRTYAFEVQEAYAVERRTSQQAMADIKAAGLLPFSPFDCNSYIYLDRTSHWRTGLRVETAAEGVLGCCNAGC